MNMSGGHAVGLQYKDSNPSIALISCAADLSHDPDELEEYAQDVRFNAKTEKSDIPCPLPIVDANSTSQESVLSRDWTSWARLIATVTDI